MKKMCLLKSFALFLLMAFSFTINAQFRYIHPLPGSNYHNPQTSIILRNGDLLDESSIHTKDIIEIYGSKSGVHTWTSTLSENKTLIIKPDHAFAWGETVYVTVRSLLRTKDGSSVEGTAFSFKIRNEMTQEQKALYVQSNDEDFPEGRDNPALGTREECTADSLPVYQINVNNNAAPGQIFHNNQSDDKSDTNSFPVILENDGSVVWTCDLGLNGHDFKINYNGYLTYFNYKWDGWMLMDSNMVVIDSFQCGNGYEDETNGHDAVIYPDGHSFVIAYNPQIIDMNEIVEGGQENALVKGLIIQELDANKEVIFEWRSWDHFLITDCLDDDYLIGATADPVHGNAVEKDFDGNLLLSSRNMSEITKINLETGDIIWRLGGENNQFTFVNDNIAGHFNYQHDIRRIANGNITLFNNGVDLPIEQSSAKEYHLDEVNKVATLIWYYEHPKIGDTYVFGSGSGSVQRLENGNTMISWGKTVNTGALMPNYTEVDPQKNILWEFTFDDPLQRGYRAHKYIWNPCEMPRPDQIVMKKITDVSAAVDWNPVNNAMSYDVQYRKIGKINWKTKSTSNTSKKLLNLKPETLYEFQVRTHCMNGYISDWTPLKTFMTNPQRTTLEKEMITFNVHPNPASGILNFNFETESDQHVTISLYDLTGKLFFTSGFDLSEGAQEVQMDVSMLPAGLFFAEMKINNERLIQKFVKQ